MQKEKFHVLLKFGIGDLHAVNQMLDLGWWLVSYTEQKGCYRPGSVNIPNASKALGLDQP